MDTPVQGQDAPEVARELQREEEVEEELVLRMDHMDAVLGKAHLRKGNPATAVQAD